MYKVRDDIEERPHGKRTGGGYKPAKFKQQTVALMPVNREELIDRTILPSWPLSWKSATFSAVGLIIVMIAETFYKKPFLDFSVNGGIQRVQDWVSPAAKSFWLTETDFGGGVELVTLVVISMVT